MTYRIKRIPHEESGFVAAPVDPLISQWNAARDAKTNSLHLDAKAYPPKVDIKNDVFPRPHETYNCTTCARGRELPQNKISKEDYHYYCRWDLKTHIGPKNSLGLPLGDNGCPQWDRRVPIPHKGYMEGVER